MEKINSLVNAYTNHTTNLVKALFMMAKPDLDTKTVKFITKSMWKMIEHEKKLRNAICQKQHNS